MNSGWKTLLKILLPIAIGGTVAFILFRNDFNPEALKSIHLDRKAWMGLALAVLFTFGREAGIALRFRTLTKGNLRVPQSFRVTFLCEFTSCITPTSVGGSAAGMLFLNREGIGLGRATTITLVTLLFDELFIVIAAPIIFAFISYKELFGFSSSATAHDLQVTFWIVYGIIAVWAAILWLGIFIVPYKIRNILLSIFSLPLLRRWKNSVEKMGDDLVTSSVNLRSVPRLLWLKVMGATALSWICRFLVVNTLLWGLAGNMEQLVVFGRQLIVWVLLMFTPTPGGSGISEWIFKEYYGDMLGTGALIMIIALTWRILTYYIYLAIGVFLLPSLTRRREHSTPSD